jgi:hypothetical protein
MLHLMINASCSIIHHVAVHHPQAGVRRNSVLCVEQTDGNLDPNNQLQAFQVVSSSLEYLSIDRDLHALRLNCRHRLWCHQCCVKQADGILALNERIQAFQAVYSSLKCLFYVMVSDRGPHALRLIGTAPFGVVFQIPSVSNKPTGFWL